VALRVSFVVVNWRQPEATVECVESIKAQRANAEIEIIVVDNESTQATRSRLESVPETILLPLKENRGFTGGMNAGFATATGDYVAAVNNDLVMAPDWLAHGLSQFADGRRHRGRRGVPLERGQSASERIQRLGDPDAHRRGRWILVPL